MKISGLNAAMLMALIGGGLAGCSHNCFDRGEGCTVPTAASTTSGKVVDGPVAGANVYFQNADGTCSTTVAGVTKSDGTFSVVGSAPNGYCASGGVDTKTNQTLVGTLKAPAGAAAATPLTTLLVAAQVEAAKNGQPIPTAAQFAAKLGLPAGADLLADPTAAGNSAILQLGSAVQAMMASIATGLGGAGNADALFADVLGSVLTAVQNGTVNLATAASSGDFTAVASTVAAAAQTAVAADTSLGASVKSTVAAADPTSVASSAANSASDSASSNAPPPAAFATLASVTANGSIQATLDTAGSTAYDSSVTIPTQTAFSSVSFGLSAATGSPIVTATGANTTIDVVPLTNSASAEHLVISIPTDWAQTGTTLTPSLTSGGNVSVAGSRTSGVSGSVTISGTALTTDSTLTFSSGTVNLDISKLITHMGSGAPFSVLSTFNGTNTAGKTYIVTTSVYGVSLKTLSSTTASPAATHSFTTKVSFQ